MNLYIQVVVFNKRMLDSFTLSSLCEQSVKKGGLHKIILNIHDNSPYSCRDLEVLAKLEKFYEVRYVHTPENKTLRDIYNLAIRALQPTDALLLLDDDTALPENYLEVAIKNIAKNPDINVFAPKVMVHGNLYSPYKSYLFISRPLTDITADAKRSSRHHAFINSGLIIVGRFFINSGFRYPKEVEFYGTDTVFSHEFRKYESEYMLMDLTINHDVNNHPENSSAENYAGALLKVMKFWWGQLHGVSKFGYSLYMFLYVLKISIKFRSLIFIKMIIGLKKNG